MRLYLGAVALTLVTAADPDTNFNVLVFGDYGSDHASADANVKAMARLIEQQAWDPARSAAVVTGDNFYPHGVTANTVDERFEKGFRKRFGAEFAFPFFVTAGDHDHRGDPEVLLVLGTRDARWVMPSLNHAQRVDLGGGRTAAFLLVDGPSLAGTFARKWHTNHGGPGAGERRTEAWAWLEKELQAAASDGVTYTFVATHFPAESACKHGPQMRGHFAGRMRALLDRHRVTAYLSGHDHCQALLRVDGRAYVVSGLGGESAYALAHDHAEELRGRGGQVVHVGAPASECEPENPGKESEECTRADTGFTPTVTPTGFGVLAFRGGAVALEFYQTDDHGAPHRTFRTELVAEPGAAAERSPPAAGRARAPAHWLSLATVAAVVLLAVALFGSLRTKTTYERLVEERRRSGPKESSYGSVPL